MMIKMGKTGRKISPNEDKFSLIGEILGLMGDTLDPMHMGRT